MKLINKDALVAEIKDRLVFGSGALEIRRQEMQAGKGSNGYYKQSGVILAYNSIIKFLNTLDVKEVDLEKEPASEDLEKAANDFSESDPPLYGDRYYWDSESLFGKQLETTFKAGANWQKEQMMKDAVEFILNRGKLYDLKPLIHERYLDYKIGQKVKIIILPSDNK